jgi:hypothetical protein
LADGTFIKCKPRIVQDIIVPMDKIALATTETDIDSNKQDNQQVKTEMRHFLDKVA